MHSRVTELEIDTLRIGVGDVVERFRREVLPRLRQEEGFEGVFVLVTPDGLGLLISLWSTGEGADAVGEPGFDPEALDTDVTLLRSSPGRERYEVAFADAPALVIG